MKTESRMQCREEKLLDAFLNGNETAFEELVRENRDRLYRVAMRILRNHDDALDVVQDSLVKAYRRAPGFRRESSFSTWLVSIVVREAINKARRDRFRGAISLHPGRRVFPVRCASRDCDSGRENQDRCRLASSGPESGVRDEAVRRSEDIRNSRADGFERGNRQGQLLPRSAETESEALAALGKR